MLRTNLSTRPFYNDRAVRTGLVVLAVIALGLTIFNAVEILRLERSGREARQTVSQNAAQAREMTEKARAIRQSINQSALQAVQVSARDANALIDRRAFSWTALLNHFQATLPADVRIGSVTPQVDDDGRMLVAIQVFARRPEDLSEFIDALETTGAFTDVLPRQSSVEEDGTWRSAIQGYYALPPAGQAVPATSASEPGRASSPAGDPSTSSGSARATSKADGGAR
jgi:hypothetical protein